MADGYLDAGVLMSHRREEVTAKRPKAASVSNWWYVVGLLIGVLCVFVFWWFIYPPFISLFY